MPVMLLDVTWRRNMAVTVMTILALKEDAIRKHHTGPIALPTDVHALVV